MLEHSLSAHNVEPAQIGEFCVRWKVSELALFGSTLAEKLTSESDIDLLVTFKEDSQIGLFDMVRMQNELKDIFGRDMDLVSRRGLEASPNYLRREEILSTALVVYEKGRSVSS